MTLGSVSASERSSAVSFCSCCGAKMVPYFNKDTAVNKNQINQLISESFLTVKGAALFLPRGNSPTPSSSPRISQRRNKHTGDLQKHLQTMFTLLRPEDTIRLAVRLESVFPQVTRYMVVVSTNGRQDTEESLVLGMDFVSSDSCCSVGLVLPLWSDTMIHLDGDGGFSVSTVNRVHVFKPVSVQAMWSALQSLHKACEVARCHNYYPGSLFLTWVSYYQSRVSSSQTCINEWNAMKDVESHRAHSPVLFTDLPTERERTERLIKMRLREIMMQKDLENVTCKEIRTELEMQMVCNLREFKEFIDNEMIVILGQMDSPTEIFEHVFLGSEWNASNLEELQNSGVRYILNVTREIDNFFPGMFEYHNIRVYDEEATNLLEYWNDTYKFISKAKKAGAKCLVHCKMGISRSASTVIAYAMKEYGWDLDTALDYVKDKRSVTKPNPSFMKQLEEYQGILLASKQRHNKLWRSHSDSDLADRFDASCKAPPQTLLRSDSHNNNTSTSARPVPPASFHHFLGVAVLQALTTANPENHRSSSSSSSSSASSTPPSSPDSRSSDGGEYPVPHAATVVPEQRADSPSRVAVTVPVPAPHPPPVIHVLPATPKAQHASPTLASTVPRHTLSLDLPGKSTSDKDLSDLTSEKATPELNSPTRSDDNNNPSREEGRGEADGSSTHSADSIDFFSAREKFLGLAQRQTDPAAVALLSPSVEENREVAAAEENKPGGGDGQSEDDAADNNSTHDNCVSVRHIVTEIEAISHPVSPLTPTTTTDPPHDPPPETPPSSPAAASVLPSEWPMGSVRRATKQLEQKLKQELLSASPRSPLHSPSSHENPFPRPHHNTQEEAKDCHETGSKNHTAILDNSSLRSQVSESQTETSLSTGASSHTSAPSQRKHTVESQSVGTARPPHTDEAAVPGCGPDCEAQSRLARGSLELARIQRTLKELQDFLHRGWGSVETRLNGDDMDTLCFSGLDEREKPSEDAGWHRAIELEARLRQAGLTPPSLMKRSASLAKLDCLELSANDLNELDIALFRSRSRINGLGSADELWKKRQRVLNLERLPLSAREQLTPCCQKDDAAVLSRRSRKVPIDKKHRAVTVLYNTM